MDIGSRAVIHHRICKHEIYVSLILERTTDHAVLDLCFDRLQIDGTLDDIVVIRRLGGLDWIVKYVAVPMLGDLVVHHGDDRLEAL